MSFAIEFTSDVRETLERLVPQVLPWATKGSSVFIKPNLTYSRFKEGVTTTPTMIVSLLGVLRDLGVGRICVGEGEGGYNTFPMSATLAAYGSAEWEKRYGAEVAVVNDWPSMSINAENRHGQHTAHFPRALRDEFDGLITLPVPKVHAMTVMTGAVKNQWGLVQDAMRLRLHLGLSELLFQFHQEVQPVGVIIDGAFGLTRNGPMLDGIALRLGWLAVATDVWTADMAMAGIMCIDPLSVPYLKYALRQGVPYEDTSSTWLPFEDDRFYLRRNAWNRVARLTWHSSRLNHLVYFSSMSTAMHKAMYKIRDAPPDLALRGRDWA